jgi:precorrin-4/cobalt-precorrin-4 C11-methyltransferase
VSRLEMDPATPVAVIYHASWPDEAIITGDLQDIAGKVEAAGIKRSALILVGGAIARTGYRRSHLYRNR